MHKLPVESIVIESRLEDIHRVGDSARSVAEHLGLPVTEVYMVELAVVEAVTNCVKHSYKSTSSHAVEITFTQEDKSLIICICDEGETWGDFESRKRGCYPFEYSSENLEEIPEGGMGLALILEGMDEVQYSRSGSKNVLVLTKRLD